MAGIEKFIAGSVRDTGVDDIVAALFGKVSLSAPAEDVTRMTLHGITEARKVAEAGGEAELRLDIEYE